VPDAPPTRRHWEDFPVGLVLAFGEAPVRREEVIEFASRFDPQPFHLDDAAARDSLFGGLCASGWHTCSIAMRLMVDHVLRHSSSLGAPGVDELRWLRPVFPGDVLSMRFEVLDKRPMATRPAVGLVHGHWQMFNQRGEAVLSMKSWGMFGRRPAAASPQPAGDEPSR
jgi:acyl dehydratase